MQEERDKRAHALYCVKMRASQGGAHVSGAERIVPPDAAADTAACLVARALAHPKGTPDAVNVKIEAAAEPLRLPALPVTTNETRTPEEGWARAAALLRAAGVFPDAVAAARLDALRARFTETYAMRGAMLLDADTLERLEPDPARGVRATCMDAAGSTARAAAVKNHYAEAIVLATKVQHAPGVIAEICVSDDPDYVTGYVAARGIGYQRITVMKEKGDPSGGRIFLYRGPRDGVAATIRFLQEQPVLVEGVTPLPSAALVRAPLDAALADDLAAIRAAGLFRDCRVLDAPTGPTAALDGRPALVLSSNDYLDLARDPRVTAAAAEAAVRWGAGSGGARLTTGTQPPHVALEEHLARFKGAEAALTFATGQMANAGTIPALVGKGDVVFSDELNHASIIDGCRLSGARVVVYRHNDMADLDRQIRAHAGARRALAVSDAVFSMDGDLLDLPSFLAVCRRHGAWSMIDEAHATGVLGATGRGLCEHFGCAHPDVLMGTLSKSLGSQGGYVCGSRALCAYLRNRARTFIFSTAPGAPAVAAADAALAVLEAEPGRVAAVRANAAFLVAELARHGVAARTQSAIVPVAAGDERRAVAAADALRRQGILIPAIRYPTVARGAARLRAAVMATHTRADIARAAAAVAAALA